MKSKAKGNKSYIQNPSVRIMLITIISAVSAIGGLLFLSINQSSISKNYNQIVQYEAANKEFISKISENISQHQAVLFRYVINYSDQEKREQLRDEAESLHEAADSYLNSFYSNVSGTGYEPYYHTIYSDLNGYFSNITIIREQIM